MDLLKFLIVDDEENIRNGLKCIIDWEKCGYKFCGEASNGKDAVSQIIDLQPDLVVLDIKMPGMTGIEVLGQLSSYYKSNNLSLPSIIILSGFSEFEYAKEALNLGAKAYLLKPVDEEQLEETVLKIAEEIKAKNSLTKSSENAKILETKDFLNKLLHQQDDGNIKKQADENFLEDSENSNYQVILFSLKYYKQDYQLDLKNAIYNYFSFFSKVVQFTTDSIILILKTRNEVAVYNSIERTAKLYNNRTFIVCGQNLKGIEGISISYNQALENQKYFFYFSNKPYLSAVDLLNHLNKYEETEIKNMLVSIIDKIVLYIEIYDKKNLAICFQQVSDIIFNIDYTEAEIKKYFIYTLLEIRNSLAKKHPEKEILDIATYDVVPNVLEKITYDEVFAYFKEVISGLQENFNTNTENSLIVKVLAYVKDNYTQDLKLETLGEMFNCNSAYLGKKFKKHTGTQFNNYLDNLRIEDAKNKLINSDYKIYQISKLVGYANTDYFFLKFKKNTGMTPKEFKKTQGIEDDSED